MVILNNKINCNQRYCVEEKRCKAKSGDLFNPVLEMAGVALLCKSYKPIKRVKDEIDKKISKRLKLVENIKKLNGPGSYGKFPCICGDEVLFHIAENNHLHAKCGKCRLVIME